MALYTARSPALTVTLYRSRGKAGPSCPAAHPNNRHIHKLSHGTMRSHTVVKTMSHSGAMRKYANWRHERCEPEIAMLNEYASRPVSYGLGFKVRKCSR